MQGLGDAPAASGQPDEAARRHERALRAYLDSAARGEVHYFHHLAGLDEPAAALHWAERDYELRPHAKTAEVLERARVRATLAAVPPV